MYMALGDMYTTEVYAAPMNDIEPSTAPVSGLITMAL